MLKEKTYLEKYKVIGDGISAVIEETGEKRELDGNELIPFLENEILTREDYIRQVQEYVRTTNQEIADLTQTLRQANALYKPEHIRDSIMGTVLKDENGKPLVRYTKRG